MDQQRPVRRMNDMGPARRMDGFGRPGGPASVQQPQARPAMTGQPMRTRPAVPGMQARPVGQPMPAARPMAQRPAMPQQRPVGRPMAAEAQPAPANVRPGKPRRERKGGGWKVALQFVVGLAVIASVAGAIVWLYIKYYQ